MKRHPVGAELFHADRQTDGRTDKTTLIVAFRNFANARKSACWRNVWTRFNWPRERCIEHGAKLSGLEKDGSWFDSQYGLRIFLFSCIRASTGAHSRFWQEIRTGSGAPSSFHFNGHWGLFPRGKANEAWSWPGWRMNGAIPPLPIIFYDVDRDGYSFSIPRIGQSVSDFTNQSVNVQCCMCVCVCPSTDEPPTAFPCPSTVQQRFVPNIQRRPRRTATFLSLVRRCDWRPSKGRQ